MEKIKKSKNIKKIRLTRIRILILILNIKIRIKRIKNMIFLKFISEFYKIFRLIIKI
jgi:hypothetical protein